MELKAWFIAALLLAALVGSSFQEEQEDYKVRRITCPKGKHRKCFIVRFRNRRRFICRCVGRYCEDEAEHNKKTGAPGCLLFDPGKGRCTIYEL